MSERWSEFSPWLDAFDLQGKSFDVTIKSVQNERLFDRKSQAEVLKPVLFFAGTGKGLVLSPTNRKMLQQLFGDMIGGCIGKKVRLEVVEVKAFGKVQNVVRISAAGSPKPPQEAPKQEHAEAAQRAAPEHGDAPQSREPAQSQPALLGR